LGSGWNKVIDQVKVIKSWTYDELFSVKSTVPGHTGKLIYGTLARKAVLIMAGRFHIYEGHTAQIATEPIRLLKKLGITSLITTAACGGLNPKYKVGDFVVLTDLITLFTPTPLVGAKFQDLSQAFDPRLTNLAEKVMVDNKLSLQKGVYVYYHGPQFETPADKMALRHLGADVVGMSTVPETIMAKNLDMKVLSLAFVTNLAFVKHDHLEVLAEANKASKQMSLLLTKLVKAI
jgi:purine-nucleoside phosphorylase